MGRSIVKFSAPPSSQDPKKYAQDGWSQFKDAVVGKKIQGVERYGKHLWVQMEGRAWHIHLCSTGWFLPAEEVPGEVDIVYKSFLHSVKEGDIRVKVHLSDGQVWNYHDSRTWGKWWVKPYNSMGDDPYIKNLGPDWLREMQNAREAMIALQTERKLKTVLCDQYVTAGLGNYLSCEAAFYAGLHPHTPYDLLTNQVRHRLCDSIGVVIAEALMSKNHDHWMVFDRKGEDCKQCGTSINYVKDSDGDRGSYFCSECQPPR